LRALLGFRFVLDVAVAVGVAVGAGPVEDAADGVPVLLYEVVAAGPAVELGEGDDEHERAGLVAVVAAEGGPAEAGEGAEADLLDRPPRLLVALGDDGGALEALEPHEGGLQQAAVQEEALPGGRERVATEEGGVEREAGRRRQPLVLRAVEQRRGAEEADGLVREVHERRVARGAEGDD